MYRALRQMQELDEASVRSRGELLRQLKWWLGTLMGVAPLESKFWDLQPEVPLVCSDASGDARRLGRVLVRFAHCWSVVEEMAPIRRDSGATHVV